MKKKLSKILAAILCVCTLTACGSGGQESTPEGESAAKDTLTIATQADMGDKDPINGITTNDTIKIKAQVYETLIERTVPEQEYKPLLAESWEFNDDATELTITLREGITTHNGETLTSEDCLFSLGLLRESANKSVTDHMDLENSYIVDDRTFVIVMDEPSMGLSPIYVNEIFDIIQKINGDGTTVLLVEQNAKKALSIANKAYVLETGNIALSGDAKELMNNDQVKKAYLSE